MSDIPRIGRPPKYPFGSLDVGDAVLIEGTKERVRPAASMFAKKHGLRFRTSERGSYIRVERVA